MNNYTMFYLRKTFWVGTCFNTLSSIHIRKDDPENLEEFVQAIEIASGRSTYIEPASMASVPQELQNVVNYALYGKDEHGGMTLLGWFDTKLGLWAVNLPEDFDRTAWQAFIDVDGNVNIRPKEEVFLNVQ